MVELVKRGADPKTVHPQTLIEAIKDMNVDVALLLLAFGADPDGKGAEEIPILRATVDWSEPIVAALIVKKANINAANPNGVTALMFAAQRGNVEVARRLIAAGGDVNLREKGGHTALWIANQKVDSRDFEKRKKTIAQLLRKAGAKE